VNREHRKPVCTYCGQRAGTTRDHIPPKSLFGKPRPTLVTVPCCEQCRGSQSLDDEYFVRMISMKSDTADNPSASAARDSALRSLTKPAKRGFANALLGTTKDLPVYSPSGIYLGQKMSYDVDLNRLCNVIARTTYGLYLDKFGHRLSDDHRCKVYAIDGFDLAAPEILAQLQKLWGHAISGERRDFGENVFTYWVRKIDGPEGATTWNFVVYGSVAFLAFTGPRAKSSGQSTEPNRN
jgi:hypothetical protein